MQNDFSYHFIQNHIVEKRIKVRLNKVIDYTNLWYELGPREYSYFSVETVDDAFQQDDGSGDLMRFKIVLDNKYSHIERRVYTFYDMLGQIGGFIDIILSTGSILTGFFSTKILMMTLLSHLFKVEVKQKYIKVVPENTKMQSLKINSGTRKFFPNKDSPEESKNYIVRSRLSSSHEQESQLDVYLDECKDNFERESRPHHQSYKL